MEKSNVGNHFLTPERRQAFARGIRRASELFTGFALETPEYKHMNPRHIIDIWRAFLCSCLIDAFQGIEGVKALTVRSTFMIIFDEKWVLHLKKAMAPDAFVSIPKTLQVDIDVHDVLYPQDQLLPGMEEFVEKKLLLSELHDLVGVYIMGNGNIIAEFHINDQQVDSIEHLAEIELTKPIVNYPDVEDELPEMTFKLKRTGSDESDAKLVGE